MHQILSLWSGSLLPDAVILLDMMDVFGVALS